ncbi:MAG: hypothetical protein AAFY71_10175 [Bacteroidota bacterium]
MKRLGTLTQGFLTVLLAAMLVGAGDWYTSEIPVYAEEMLEFEASPELLPAPEDDYLAGIIMNEADEWKGGKIEEDVHTGLPMGRFLAALQKLEARPDRAKVRIAYFGDSMIEGDRITQSLRNDLQSQYGGTGVGFVPVVYANYGDRRTIWHRFSGDWEDMNFMKPARPKYGFGISGEYFLTSQPKAAGRTWVRYKGSKEYDTTQEFQQIRLFYGPRMEDNPKEDYYVAVKTDTRKDTFFLSGEKVVNESYLSKEVTKEIKLNFRIPKDMPVYGLSFESPSGIFVDNFSARGHSGMNLVEIPEDNLSQFSKLLDYDLIVLQFGLNVVSKNRKDFSSYEKGMKRVVEHFQKNAPNSDILIVSVSDKSTRIGGSLQTDPSVPLIVKAQERVARQTNSAFLNLYQQMGGRNSMIQWVKARPSLARNDYAHPNRRGAIKVGNIVRDYLNDEYGSFVGTPSVPNKSMAIK